MKKFLLVGLFTMLGVLMLAEGYGQYVPNQKEPTTNRGYIVLRTAAKVDSATAVNTANVFIYTQFFGGTSAFHINGEVTKNAGSPAGKCYFVVGDVPTKLARIDSVNIYNETLKRFTFRLPAGHASYSYYGLELATTAGTSSVRGTAQGKTAPEIKSN